MPVRQFKSLHFGRIPGVMIRREYLTGYWFGEMTIFTFLNIQMHFAHILEEPVVASPKTRRSSRIQSQVRLKKCLILRPGFPLLMPSQGRDGVGRRCIRSARGSERDIISAEIDILIQMSRT